MLPGLEFVLPFGLIDTAPEDMYAALGKNDQKIYVIPSMDMVVVRTGDPGQEIQLGPSGYDTDLWAYLSDLECAPTGLKNQTIESLEVYPNPAHDLLHLGPQGRNGSWVIMDLNGRTLSAGFTGSGSVDVSDLADGHYILQVIMEDGIAQRRFIKQ